MGWTSDLLIGVAEYLHAGGAGVWAGRTGLPEETTAGQPPAIVLINLPSAPERVICLTDYVVGQDDPSLTDVVTGLQVRIRGTRDPLDSSDVRDAVYDQLHGLHGVTLNGVVVAQMVRESAIPLGPDAGGRFERSESYTVQANRPGAHRDEG